MLSPERQSARMSKITNDGLTQSGKGCFIAVSIWQQSVSPSQRVIKDDVCLSPTSMLNLHLAEGVTVSHDAAISC